MPVEHGSTTHKVATVATAASMALPPAFNTSNPACAAKGWLVATNPLPPITFERRLGKENVSKFIAYSLESESADVPSALAGETPALPELD
jgi:hypothetical protein